MIVPADQILKTSQGCRYPRDGYLAERAAWLADEAVALDADIQRLVGVVSDNRTRRRSGGTADAFESPAEIAAYEGRPDA